MRLLLAASLLALSAASVHAETFTVTRTDDPVPDGCQPGDCSLREAMKAAAANDPLGATDVVIVPAGTIQLTLRELTVVAQRLRVQGAGSSLTRIVQTEEFTDTFHTAAGGDLAVIGMSLDSFRSPVSSCYAGYQGVPLFIDDVVFEGGSLQTCGATTVRHSEVRTSLYCNYGQTLVEDSTIRSATVQGSDSTLLTLRRVLVDGELDPDNPYVGDVHLLYGTLIAEDTTITRSEVYAVNASVNIALRRVHYLDNIGPLRTEGADTVTIEDSLFENNAVRALYAAGGAEWNVTGSSFVNNRVDGNAGGAILLEDDTVLRVRNSTFSGNTFSNAAAANGARGAAIGYRHASGAHLIVVHSTIVAPAGMPAGVVGSAIGGHDAGIAVDIANSIVRGSCGMNAHLLQNNSGDIESPGNTCGLDEEQNYVSVSSTRLALGPLADNGGPTPTILPGVGSLAINRGGTPQCLPTDQRGYARPGGARCDIGAVEADADDTLFADGFDG